VFLIEAIDILPNYYIIEYYIDLEPGFQLLYSPIYTLLERELEVLREYLNTSLEKEWIRYSTSPAGIPIIFILKKRGGLYLYIDYRGLNKITIKNRILLLLISKIIDRLYRIKVYIKLDLKDTYYRL
jgi:hypothetical protein